MTKQSSFFCLFIFVFFPFHIINAQINNIVSDSTVEFRWVSLNEGIPKRSRQVSTPVYQEKFERQKIKIPYKAVDEKNQLSSSSLSWEKLSGPYGGSVRKIREFENEIYAVTDREVFRLTEEEWDDLKFSNISVNTIYDIHVFKNENIIINTDFGVFELINGATTWKKKYIDENQSGLQVNDIIYNQEYDSVLLATTNGIYISDNSGELFEQRSLNGIDVKSISYDSNKYLWALTSDSLFKSESLNNNWVPVLNNDDTFRYIFSDSTNSTYLYSWNGLIKTNNGGETWMQLTGSGFGEVNNGPKGGATIIAGNQMVFVGPEDEISLNKIAPQHLLSTYLLNENNLMIGSLGSGVYKYKIDEQKYSHFSKGINVSTIRSLIELGNGDIVICTDSDSIFISKKGEGPWESIAPYWSMNMVGTLQDEIYLTLFPGKFFKSDNYGQNWKELVVGDSSWIVQMDATEAGDYVYAIDIDKRIFRSKDRGDSFKMINESFKGRIASYEDRIELFKVLSDNSVILVSNGLYFSNDAGLHFIQIQDSTIGGVYDALEDKYGFKYLSTTSGFYRSINGVNWYLISEEMNFLRYLDLDINSNIYGGYYYGNVYLSQDQGKTWDVISNNLPNTVSWSFLVSDSGTIYYGTQDKGLFKIKFDPPETADLKDFSFLNNYPNPFNAFTTFEYTLHKKSHVKVQIYDILGRLVKVLVDEIESEGKHFKDWTPSSEVASGFYLYRIVTDKETYSGKMMYLK